MSRRLAVPVASARCLADRDSCDASRLAPGLLISVRSAAEAAALTGLDLAVLDIKEPHAGPLAAASPEVWQAIADQNEKSRHPWRLSVALGECEEAIFLADKVLPSMTFAKAGPANISSLKSLESHWTTIRERIPPSVDLVAVAYADHLAAKSLPANEIFAFATRFGFKTWLLDTFEKNGSSTRDHLTTDQLREIAELARQAGAKWVLAGSMRREMLQELAESDVFPDLWGVRGDVCEGSRIATIDRLKVQNWLALLSNRSHPG